MFWRRMNKIGAASKGELTRERIVAAAAVLFNQRGFAGCSMSDVMEATGLEKGGLYRHFRSKEELAAEAFRHALRAALRVRTDDLDKGTSAVEHLRVSVARFVERPSVTPGGCPLMNTAIDADDGNPRLRELALDGIRGWKRRLEGLVRAGLKHGEIRKGTEPRAIANGIVATLEGALMISRLEGRKDALRDAQALLNAMLDGLLVGKEEVRRGRPGAPVRSARA